MAANGAVGTGKHNRGDIAQSLFLFAISATIWITYNSNRNNRLIPEKKHKHSKQRSTKPKGQSTPVPPPPPPGPPPPKPPKPRAPPIKHPQHRPQQRGNTSSQRSQTVTQAWRRRGRISKHHHRHQNRQGQPKHSKQKRPPPPPPPSVNRRSRLSFDGADDFGVLYEETAEDLVDWEEDEEDEDGVEAIKEPKGAEDEGKQNKPTQMKIHEKTKEMEPELKEEMELLEDGRKELMDRITMSDSVLCRQTSNDFHPRNSNWSHFESYHSFASYNYDSSPRVSSSNIVGQGGHSEGEDSSSGKDVSGNNGMNENVGLNYSQSERDDDDDDEGFEEEDFLWSEPPRKHKHTVLDDQNGESSVHRRSNDKTEAEKKELDNNAPSDTKQFLRRSSSEIVRHFNSKIMPNKLIMVRHGQSEGNINELLFSTKPDNAMMLTKLGWDMARMAGKALREQLTPGETVHFVVSPYARTVETFHGIMSAWCDPEEFAHIPSRKKRLKAWYMKLMEMGLTWHEDPRIREQDFGNYQDPEKIKQCKKERHKFGAFYYRFPHGESASDVFDRVSTFLDSLWRSFESQRAENYVLVTHGISIRVFLARYFRYSIDQFNMLANPKNGEMVILAHDGCGRLMLDGRCELELSITNEQQVGEGDGNKEQAEKEQHTETKKGVEVEVLGYKKHQRLRTLPPNFIQARAARMYYSDECNPSECCHVGNGLMHSLVGRTDSDNGLASSG